MKNLLNYLILVILVTLTILLTKIYLEVKADGGQCLQNPLIFGAKKYNEATQSQLSCTCSFTDTKYTPFTFSVDGIKPIIVNRPSDPLDFNTSAIGDLFK